MSMFAVCPGNSAVRTLSSDASFFPRDAVRPEVCVFQNPPHRTGTHCGHPTVLFRDFLRDPRFPPVWVRSPQFHHAGRDRFSFLPRVARRTALEFSQPFVAFSLLAGLPRVEGAATHFRFFARVRYILSRFPRLEKQLPLLKGCVTIVCTFLLHSLMILDFGKCLVCSCRVQNHANLH